MSFQTVRRFLCAVYVAGLSLAVADTEPSQKQDEAVQWPVDGPDAKRMEELMAYYYNSGYWHYNRFILPYVYSHDIAEARTFLDIYRRYIQDSIKLPDVRIDGYILLYLTYARLAWMAKVEGDEAEFKRLVGQSVFNLRLFQLYSMDDTQGTTTASELNAPPPSDNELYDVLYMALALDRNSGVRWLKQSDYDFDGFLKTLQPE